MQRLLESEACDVVMAVLRVLYVLAVPRSTRQVVADIKFTSKLTTLAGSWGALGAGERVMSIASCCLDEVDEVRTFFLVVIALADAVLRSGDRLVPQSIWRHIRLMKIPIRKDSKVLKEIQHQRRE